MPESKSSLSTVWTIGHSTRSFPEFVALLAQHGIEILVDVRRFPGSRRHPQYAREAMELALVEHHVDYRWMPELGGRRRPLPHSPNTAWRNTSFRGYADYMATESFANAFEELSKIARAQRTVLMCAELLWWRCHRALISDALRVRGVEVIHIVDATHTVAHPFTSAARVIDGQLSYAASDDRQQMPLL